MNILHLDFETYYDREYSLKKMTMVEYIMDARFQPIILSYAWNNEPVQRLYGFKQMKEFIDAVDWNNVLLNAQNCVTGDHEVFTPDGWVRFDELDDDTEVMQWDVTTGKGTFVKPSFVVRKPYKGVMYKSDTHYHKGIYTPNHRFVFDTPSSKQGWRFEVAEKIAERQPNQIYIPVGVSYEVDNPLELDHNLIRFIEATRADGYIDPKTFAISFHFSKQRKIDRLIELAELLDMKTTIKHYSNSGSTQIRCYGDNVDFVKNLMGHKKILHWEWVKSLSLANRITWLEELRYWDGHSNSSFTTGVHSARKEEIQLLEMMAQISGYQSYASYDNPNTRGWSKPDGVLHRLTVRSKQRIKLIERPEKIQFDGMVYCVNVPTGAFLVRRQGKAWITGNCQFDASILALRFGKYARAYTDTMAMARVTGAHVIAGGASLEKIAELLISLGYPIPPKGKEVASASGKRLYNGWVSDKPFYLAEERTGSTVEMNAAVELLEAYGQYCDNDVELARQAFNYFRTLISPQEMAFGDMILKCYIQPQFYLDEQIIREEIVRIENRDKEKIQATADIYFGGNVELMRGTMRSAPKFTAFLKSIGGVLPYEFEYDYDPEDYRFEIPYKYSEKKGKNEPCFSKTHPPVIDILEGDDEELVTIFQMKLALTSSIERTRAERFLSISQLKCGFGMPYSVSGAHTHRLGGSGGLNVQNLSSGRKEGQSNALKRSITAPDGYVCVAADSSQVECLDGQGLVLTDNGLKRMLDVSIDDKVWDGVEYVSHLGLVSRGVKRVIEYKGIVGTPDHVVYLADGGFCTLDEAKARQLPLLVGEREGQAVRQMDGVRQADTIRKYEKTVGTLRVWDRETNPILRPETFKINVLQSVFEQETRTLHARSEKTTTSVAGALQCNSRASESEQVYEQNICRCRKPFHQLRTFRNLCVGEVSYGRLHGIGNRPHRHERTLRTKQYSAGYKGAKRPNTQCECNGGVQWRDDVCIEIPKRPLQEVGQRPNNQKIENGYDTTTGTGLCGEPCSSMGIVQRAKNDEVEVLQTVCQSVCTDVCVEELGYADTTEWGNQYCGTIEVYDLVEAGSRNRFCYNGVIVSNCRVLPYIANDLPYLQVFLDGKDPYSVLASQIYGGDPDEIKRLAKAGVEPYSNIQRPAGKAGILGAGFGTGWVKFKDFAKQMGVELTDEESQNIIQVFRQSHPQIVNFWKKCDWVLGQMVAGNSGWFGGLDDRLFYFDGARQLHGQTVPSIRLPDGNWLHYYGLCVRPKEMPDGSTKMNYCYLGMKEGRIQWIFTFGARITENLTQALAFSAMKHQAMLINRRYRIAGNTHDEWFITVPEEQAEEAYAYMEWCMRQVPTWANGLPLDCEGSYAKHYGDCK